MNLRLVKGNREYTITEDNMGLLCDTFFDLEVTKEIFESLLSNEETQTSEFIRRKSFYFVLNKLASDIHSLRLIIGKKITPCTKTRSVQNLKANKF